MRRTGGRLRAALFLGVSGAAALVATGIVGGLLLALQLELRDAENSREVVIHVPVASHDLGRGAPIGDTDLMLLEVPEALVEPSVLRQVDQAVGRVTRERILAGEPIRPERLSAPHEGTGLAAVLARNHRALSVELSGAGQVSGFVEPGNRVDILSTIAGPDDEPTETTTLLEGVRVLAVNEEAEGVHAALPSKPSVTLELTPADVERITHAAQIGTLRLTLRSSIDLSATLERPPITTDGLLGHSPEVRVPVSEFYRARQQAPTIVIIQGPNETVETIRSTP